MSRFFVAACAALILQACAGHHVETIDVDEPPVGKYYDITGDGAQAMDGYAEPEMVASGSAASEFDLSLASFDPSVEIYALDGGGRVDRVVPSPVPSVQPSYASNPNVEIFPLDDVQAAAWSQPDYVSPVSSVLTPQPGEAAVSYHAPVYPEAAGEPNFVEIETPGEPLVRIYFGHDATNLAPSDVDDIMAVSSRFNPNREFSMISVEGYASVESSEPDPLKRRIVNMKISMERAYSVARALMEAGIPPEKIRTVAWGEDQTISSPERARRVDVHEMPRR